MQIKVEKNSIQMEFKFVNFLAFAVIISIHTTFVVFCQNILKQCFIPMHNLYIFPILIFKIYDAKEFFSFYYQFQTLYFFALFCMKRKL
jgi:hypothetical protein